MKKSVILSIMIVAILTTTCSSKSKNNQNNQNMETTAIQSGKVVHLTTEQFKKEVFDYSINKEWKYAGQLPAIVDFYAHWCGPCKMVAPILDELAKEYDGKIIIYKVNTDEERELSAAFGIQSIPTIVFIPKDGQPQASMGALPKQSFVNAINEILLKN